MTTHAFDHASWALERLLPRLEQRFADAIATHPTEWAAFAERLRRHFPRLFDHLTSLYSGHYDFFYYLEELLATMADAWLTRSPELKALDAERETHPDWFQHHTMIGGVCYVDLFAGTLNGVREKLPYFKELGLTYLHLMPLFKTRPGENDGGYAVSDYRQVEARLGTIDDLRRLARDLRREGISLVLDFVLNHTADDHPWAQQARRGHPLYRQYYWIFPDRTMPDAYERHLREIFPEEHPGAFSPLRDEATGREEWVWTTFHTYQWDLNYSNPATFVQMASEMLFLANVGADVLRFDALAFTWKALGTNCENLPQAHTLIRAFNAVARIAAPGLLFKSEAIVHPDDVVKYIAPEECQLSYNPLLMALLWNTLATREVNLLEQALRERHALPPGTAWVNYVRCHDDIGWTFSDEDAARLGINGYDHRRFLNAFYTGRFPGSFARGLPFQENPKTGDARVSGTCASLAGLEKALLEEGEHEVELAIRRIWLLYGITMTAGGIPLIYLGDEIGVLNDYEQARQPHHLGDSRWVHRVPTDWERMARRHDPHTLEGRIYEGFQRLIRIRRQTPALGGNTLHVITTGNPHVLAFVREHAGDVVLVFANFKEAPQTLEGDMLRRYGYDYEFEDLFNGERLSATHPLTLEPVHLRILRPL
ncbi:amylosucrase [Ardenticatena maritima]|uniref:Amylosucrase n=1 Tax=Ardenticatena maritima TaxID=872965 RepID=A0A0M8KBL0_9CHLR|nr:alpha-amylase family glycosyl hydrolase [Ardenticatena maritima]KPL89161.1 amylosucrase [Ardenticatena maritima]GAP64399.1 amylosucrase [Ardenticatena maritima]